MKVILMGQKWLVAIACVGIVFPLPAFASADSPPVLNSAAQATSAVSDVSLHDGGLLMGVVSDAQGAPVASVPVTLRQQGVVLVTATTDESGQFAVNGVRPGVYQVETPQGSGIYRAWAPNTAPPSAQSHAYVTTVAYQNPATTEPSVPTSGPRWYDGRRDLRAALLIGLVTGGIFWAVDSHDSGS